MGTQTAAENTAAAQSRHPRAAVALDVAAVVGLPIDALRQTLGTPREAAAAEPTAAQLRTPAAAEWVNTFEANGTTLVATFNARTRKVRDVVVPGTNETELLEKANLSLTAADYIVLPVVDPEQPNVLLGLRVVAQHKAWVSGQPTAE